MMMRMMKMVMMMMVMMMMIMMMRMIMMPLGPLELCVLNKQFTWIFLPYTFLDHKNEKETKMPSSFFR